MTTYQSQSNGYVAFKEQSALGTIAGVSGATLLRSAGGQGLRLTKAAIESNEVRRDGMRIRGRHGTQKIAGDYTAELGVGTHEAIMEAVMRDTWDASALTLTQSDFTSLASTSSVITFGSGDPRTLGLRMYDVVYFTGLSASGNNSRNCRIIAMSSSTITVSPVDGEAFSDFTADTSCSIIRPKKLIQFAGGSLLKRYFTVEEHDADILYSEVAQDFVWGGIKFSWSQANTLIMADPSGIGTGRMAVYGEDSPADAPYFTSPSEPAGTPLAVVDATIRVNGEDVVDLTSLDVEMNIGPTAPDVFGSGSQKYSPDVFSGQMAVTINMSALRRDLTRLLDFIDETPYSLHLMAEELSGSPKEFVSIVVPNFTLGDVQKSALSKEGGPRTQTIAIPPALVGKDLTGTGYDATMIKLQSTGA